VPHAGGSLQWGKVFASFFKQEALFLLYKTLLAK
jgi:hypothetical protein